MLHLYIMIACVIIIQISVPNSANILEVEEIRTTISEPPKDDVKIEYIGPTTRPRFPYVCPGGTYSSTNVFLYLLRENFK
ncbi:unnamed protein product [Gordionus sp. m RMFG-2023]